MSVFLLYCLQTEAKTYTVVPDQVSKGVFCVNATECTLMYYATHSSEYFTKDNTTFQFEAGNHSLVNSTRVIVANISNLTLRGNNGNESLTRVACTGLNSGSFVFYNITNLTIENLSFDRCSGSAVGFNGLIAVEILLAHDLTMSNVYIGGTAGYGLSLTDVYGSSDLSNIMVEYSYNTSHASGGNFAFNCTASPKGPITNHTLSIKKSFFRNGNNSIYGVTSPSSGMYFHIKCQTDLKIVLDVSLTGNKAGNGGNIGITYVTLSCNWTVSIHIVNSRISQGMAQTGGGMYLVAIAEATNSSNSTCLPRESQFLTIENTKIENNRAEL